MAVSSAEYTDESSGSLFWSVCVGVTAAAATLLPVLDPSVYSGM